MIKNCKYFKTRIHNNKKEKRIYYYCTLLRKEITVSQCWECDNKEYKCSPVDKKENKSSVFKKKSPVKCDIFRRKETKCINFDKKQPVKIKKRTYKQSKKEKNRYSLFTEDLEHCIICGRSKQHLHEIFGGRNRSNSIEYGLVLPLCSTCHRRIHDTSSIIEEWHKKGQTMFNQVYPDLDFIEIFFKNYL